jgi:hypothetical protein
MRIISGREKSSRTFEKPVARPKAREIRAPTHFAREPAVDPALERGGRLDRRHAWTQARQHSELTGDEARRVAKDRHHGGLHQYRHEQARRRADFDTKETGRSDTNDRKGRAGDRDHSADR